MNGTTRNVLEAENETVSLPMASTTKIMTALVVLENVGLGEKVSIPKEAVGIEGSSLYIKEGEVYTIEELLYGLMLRSANDCAVALAWYVCDKDPAGFVDLMNEKAESLGLENTHFKNPNGLPEDGHLTTAYDLAVIMSEAMKNDDFARITGTKSYQIKGETIVNHNKLLSLYDGCIGGKTGYTMEAGRCLVTVAERNGARLICVTLGRRDDWNIHASAYEKWFMKLSDKTLLEKNKLSLDLPVAGGGTVSVTNYQQISIPLFEGEEAPELRFLAAPFIYGNKEIGDVVGTVECSVNGVTMGESPLVLCQSIDVPVQKELFLSRLFRFFHRLFLKKK